MSLIIYLLLTLSKLVWFLTTLLWYLLSSCPRISHFWLCVVKLPTVSLHIWRLGGLFGYIYLCFQFSHQLNCLFPQAGPCKYSQEQRFCYLSYKRNVFSLSTWFWDTCPVFLPRCFRSYLHFASLGTHETGSTTPYYIKTDENAPFFPRVQLKQRLLFP